MCEYEVWHFCTLPIRTLPNDKAWWVFSPPALLTAPPKLLSVSDPRDCDPGAPPPHTLCTLPWSTNVWTKAPSPSHPDCVLLSGRNSESGPLESNEHGGSALGCEKCAWMRLRTGVLLTGWLSRWTGEGRAVTGPEEAERGHQLPAPSRRRSGWATACWEAD